MKGHMTQRSPGSWSLVIDMGKDPATGKRKQKWITFRGGKRAAQDELNRILTELRSGGFVEPSKVTLGEYLTHWLENAFKPAVRPKTYQTYAQFARVHLTPALGSILLQRLTPLDIQQYFTQALEHGRHDGKGGLSPKSVRHQYTLLGTALRQAVRWGLLQKNPCEAVTPPRVERREPPSVTAEQAGRLIAAADGTPLEIPVLLALATGMRRGEVLGLKWAAVNLEAGTLAVAECRISTDKGAMISAPKTKAGRRTVTLPGVVIAALRRHRGRQAQQQLLAGLAYQSSGLVCC